MMFLCIPLFSPLFSSFLLTPCFSASCLEVLWRTVAYCGGTVAVLWLHAAVTCGCLRKHSEIRAAVTAAYMRRTCGVLRLQCYWKLNSLPDLALRPIEVWGRRWPLFRLLAAIWGLICLATLGSGQRRLILLAFPHSCSFHFFGFIWLDLPLHMSY